MRFLVFLSIFVVIIGLANAGFFDEVKEWFGGAAESAGDFAGQAKEKLSGAASDVGEWAKRTGSRVHDYAKNVTFDDIVDGAKAAGSKVSEVAQDVYHKVTSSGTDDDHIMTTTQTSFDRD